MRTAREELGLSQTEFGAEVGLTQRKVSRYERYDAVPRVDAAIRIATFLRLDFADFIIFFLRDGSPRGLFYRLD